MLERGEEYPSLNLAAPSMVTRESEASRSTIPAALAAYDALGYSSPLFAVIETDPLPKFTDGWHHGIDVI